MSCPQEPSSTGYGAPTTPSPRPSTTSYGSPPPPAAASDSYGPSTAAPSSYGSPTADPVTSSYGSPTARPATSSYGSPTAKPGSISMMFLIFWKYFLQSDRNLTLEVFISSMYDQTTGHLIIRIPKCIPCDLILWVIYRGLRRPGDRSCEHKCSHRVWWSRQ